MRAGLFVLGLAVAACSLPTLADLGAVTDAGTCEVIAVPGACGDVPDLARWVVRLVPHF